ncbi:MAG: hypothetical protein KGI49_03105 [Patescibacteria group bacterium]|nr:hypothetical protein [Patescibacteria group bacterium]
MQKKVTVNDLMQKNYRYERTEPAGRNFAPGFRPGLTPKEMLRLGVFGGVYMRDCKKEFPADWWKGAKLAPDGSDKRIARLNYFGENASQPLSVWQKKGWIDPRDPRGWFEWYCRYYMGRRINGPSQAPAGRNGESEDERQIRRWKAIGRHIAQLQKHCRRGDFSCRPRQRQAILHWAYDSRRM